MTLLRWFVRGLRALRARSGHRSDGDESPERFRAAFRPLIVPEAPPLDGGKLYTGRRASWANAPRVDLRRQEALADAVRRLPGGGAEAVRSVDLDVGLQRFR